MRGGLLVKRVGRNSPAVRWCQPSGRPTSGGLPAVQIRSQRFTCC